jgi:hypothetical protein
MRFFAPRSGTRLEAELVNGEPGIVAMRKAGIFAVVVLTVKQGLITGLYAQADPRKPNACRAHREVVRPRRPAP